LSTHSTVAAPSISTAGMWRVSTPSTADSPRTERQKHRQHHREFFRQDRHRERQSREHRGERVAAQRVVEQRYRRRTARMQRQR
jgi:hypothetical protein